MEEKFPADNELPLFTEVEDVPDAQQPWNNPTPVSGVSSIGAQAEPVMEEPLPAEEPPREIPQEDVPAAGVSGKKDPGTPPAAGSSEAAPAAAAGKTAGKVWRVPAGLVPTPEFGIFLKRVREANGLTLDDLARITRIKHGYLDALERESFAELPAAAYTLAYIKVLAALYQMPQEDVAVLTGDVRKNLEYEAPEENKTVVGFEPSDENRILLRRILLIGGGGAFFLAAVISLAVFLLTARNSGPQENVPADVQGGAAPVRADETRILELQPAPVLRTHVLPVPRNQ